MNEDEIRQKAIENLVLLVIGAKPGCITALHLQKEVFILWRTHPDIPSFIKFIKHYRGPFSREIDDAIHKPIFLENCWKYRYQIENELSGGNICITNTGKEEYKRILSSIKKDDDSLNYLIISINLLRRLYDKLSDEELLLLIYDTYPEYVKKSSVYNKIYQNRKVLAYNLLLNNIIDIDRYNKLVEE